MAAAGKSQNSAGPPSPADASPTTPVADPAATSAVGQLPAWTQIGVVLFFLATCAFGVLEVHSSTDTWIGLAAGRQIMTSDQFPVADTFSYTFNGTTWFNQNWLSHVYFWLLYDHLGHDWVIYGTWAAAWGMFVCVLLATYFRGRSWLAATFAAAMVAGASRDWLSARPATIQFLCLGVLWLCISALLSQRGRSRWWPIPLLFLLFLGWPHAHGSFVFGYGMLFLFWVLTLTARLLKLPTRVTTAQLIAVAFVACLTFVLGGLLSPYGWDNYTHFLKVTESPVFRKIGEWITPFGEARFPPVTRFWVAFGVFWTSLLVAFAMRMFGPEAAPLTEDERRRKRKADRRPRPRTTQWHVIAFDVLSVAIGLNMVLWARRFAPLFYILATPALVHWIVLLGRPLVPRLRGWARDVIIVASWVAAAYTVYITATLAHTELVKDVILDRPQDLLNRVTRADRSAQEIMDLLRKNNLKPNIFTEWTQAGLFMFFVPEAHVFIDGRSQQVYSEKHYLQYMALCAAPPSKAETVAMVLRSYGTDAVILPRSRDSSNLLVAFDSLRDWAPIYESPRGVMFADRDSELFEEIMRREAAGDLWWPDSAWALAARGRLAIMRRVPDADRALELFRAAAEESPRTAIEVYRFIVDILARQNRVDAARDYINAELARWQELTDVEMPYRKAADAELHRLLASLP